MSVSPPAPAHGGNVWAAARRHGTPVGEWLDFSADLNPWAANEVPAEVVEKAWAQVRHYPDPFYRRFREAAAEWEGVGPECILPGNGSSDLIHLLTRRRKESRACIPVPTFTEYARAVLADGGGVESWPLWNGEAFSDSAFPDVLRRSSCNLVFLCNPNNPTGMIWARETVLEALSRCEEKGGLLAVDEAFMDLVADGPRYSLARQAAGNRHLMVLRSMTKSFDVPGLRIGYAVCHPDGVRRMERIQPPWSVNTMAAEIGIWLLRSGARLLAPSRRELESARLDMETALRGMGLRVFPSHANFLLCRIPETGRPAVSEVALGLEGKGILIRRCDDFQGLEPDRFFRAAVRRPEENRRLVAALNEVLNAG